MKPKTVEEALAELRAYNHGTAADIIEKKLEEMEQRITNLEWEMRDLYDKVLYGE